MRARILPLSVVTAAAVLLPASSALVAAPSGAEPGNVGGFISAAAQELGEFGASVSGARELPRRDCGL